MLCRFGCVSAQSRLDAQKLPRAPDLSIRSKGPDGSRLVLSVPGDALARAPHWRPGGVDPPISFAKASSIAMAWAAAHRGRFDELRIREVSLTSMPCTSIADYWYYIVWLDPMLSGERFYSQEQAIAILMDGTIIEPHKDSAGS